MDHTLGSMEQCSDPTMNDGPRSPSKSTVDPVCIAESPIGRAMRAITSQQRTTPVKLSRIPAHPAARCGCLATFALLGACATTSSQPVVEQLDPDTATTLTVVRKPVELLAAGFRNGGSDPFAFIAPFETDRMGHRVQYLWMSAPGVEGVKVEPRLLCDGQALTLAPVESDVAHLGLSRAPYEKPAPWSLQWYFQLPPDTLKCLAGAQRITLESRADGGQTEQFTVESKGLAALKAFSSHY